MQPKGQRGIELPRLPRRDAVIYPNLLGQLLVMRNTSSRAVEEAQSGEHSVVVARAVAQGDKVPTLILLDSFLRYLRPPVFTWGMAEEKDEVGVATGVARTEAGGDVLSVEVTMMEGEGNLILTGQLGEVVRESAQAALSFCRSRGKQLKIASRFFDTKDIHIHVPAGAVPKDGPSAGVTMATALASALTQRAARKDVAMTGEVTLRCRVLRVGGIRDKVLAAYRAGIKTFVMPAKNRKDLVDIPIKVKKDLHFQFVDSMEDVLKVALVGPQQGGAS